MSLGVELLHPVPNVLEPKPSGREKAAPARELAASKETHLGQETVSAASRELHGGRYDPRGGRKEGGPIKGTC